MTTKRAKILTSDQFKTLVQHVSVFGHGHRDVVLLNLSFRAGLRAMEIAGLKWSHILGPDGDVGFPVEGGGRYFTVFGATAKGGKGRDIPLHNELYQELVLLRSTRPSDEFVIYALRPDKTQSTSASITMYLKRLYNKVGLSGCSSHSGRRTFLTSLARSANNHGCSLHDVQMLAGHSSIRTTQKYIEPSNQVTNLVNAL